MRVAVNSHALPIYKKNRIASLLCIFETIISYRNCRLCRRIKLFSDRGSSWLLRWSVKSYLHLFVVELDSSRTIRFLSKVLLDVGLSLSFLINSSIQKLVNIDKIFQNLILSIY